jgi:predicted XRE-type DNA-binding protein
MMTIPRNSETQVIESSGNVFADMGRPDAKELLAKAELVHQISVAIRERRLTKQAAARTLDLSDDELAALLRGALSTFSMEQLIHFLTLLGREVEIVVRPAAHPA